MVIGRGDSYRIELKCVVPDLGFSLESPTEYKSETNTSGRTERTGVYKLWYSYLTLYLVCLLMDCRCHLLKANLTLTRLYYIVEIVQQEPFFWSLILLVMLSR